MPRRSTLTRLGCGACLALAVALASACGSDGRSSIDASSHRDTSTDVDAVGPLDGSGNPDGLRDGDANGEPDASGRTDGPGSDAVAPEDAFVERDAGGGTDAVTLVDGTSAPDGTSSDVVPQPDAPVDASNEPTADAASDRLASDASSNADANGDAPSIPDAASGPDAKMDGSPTDGMASRTCVGAPLVASGSNLFDNEICSADGQCASGHCVDGVCCDTACAGSCASCNVVGHRGVCTAVQSARDLDSCAGAHTCSATGSCLLADEQGCSASSECAFGACVSGRCCAGSTCHPVLDWQFLLSGPGGSASAWAVGVAPDGSVYVSGNVSSGADLDPSPACTDIAPLGMHIIKFAPDGRYVWGRVIRRELVEGGTNGAGPFALVATSDGGVAITGQYSGSIDFDAGPGTDVRSTAGPGNESFVTKYAGDGTYLWTRTWGYQSPSPTGLIETAEHGLIVSGYYDGTIDLDPSAGVDTHTTMTPMPTTFEGYLLKLDSAGGFVWGRTFPTSSRSIVNSIAVGGPDGRIAIVLSAYGDVDVDPGPTARMITASGTYVPSVMVMLAPDGTYRWHRYYSGALWMSGAIATSGDFVAMGTFTGTVDFDSSGTHAMLTSQGTSDLFVTRVGGDGTYRWTRTIHTQSQGAGSAGIVAGPGDTAFILGFTTLTNVDLDPGPGVDLYNPTNFSDSVIVQFSAAGDHLWSAVLPRFRQAASGPHAALVVGADAMAPISGGLVTKFAP